MHREPRSGGSGLGPGAAPPWRRACYATSRPFKLEDGKTCFMYACCVQVKALTFYTALANAIRARGGRVMFNPGKKVGCGLAGKAVSSGACGGRMGRD